MKASSTPDTLNSLRKQLADAHREIERLKSSSPDNAYPSEYWEDLKFGRWEWDVGAELPFRAPGFMQMLGFDPDKVSINFWRERIFDEDLSSAFREFKKHVDSQGQYPLQVYLRCAHKKGHTLHVWARGKVVRWNDDGTPARVSGGVADVTDLLESRGEISDVSETLDLLVEGIDAGIWDWNVKADTVKWSAKFFRLLGYEPGEVDPNDVNLWDHMPEEDRDKVKTALEQHLTQRKPYNTEFRVRTKDGKIKWMMGRGQTKYGKQGNPERLVGSMIDITDHKQLESKLYEQNKQFVEAEKVANIGSWEFEVESGRVSWSDQLYDIHGVGKDFDPRFENVMELYHEEDRPEMLRAVERAVEDQKPYVVQTRMLLDMGEVKWLLTKGIPVTGPTGKVVKLRGVCQDIDERKQKELEIERAQEQLARQNAIYREAEKAAKIGSWEQDLETGEVIWSDQVYRIRGLSPDHVPTYDEIRKTYVEGSGEVLEKAVKEAIEEKKPYELELQLKTAPGDVIWVRAYGTPVINAKGKVTRLRGFLQDINELKQNELELREKELLLSEASSIAHIGAWSYDVATGQRTWSREVYNIYEVPWDFPVEESPGFYDPDTKKMVGEAFAKSIKTGKPFSLEMKVGTGTGRRKWVKAEGKAVKNDRGEVVQLRGFFQDIDEAKERQLQIDEAQQELAQQNLIYREAEKAAKIGSWEYDLETSEVQWSDEMYSIYALPRDFELTLETARERLLDESREIMRATVAEAIEKGKPYEEELQLRTGHGAVIWVKVQGIPVTDDEGKVLRLRGVVQDIDDYKRNALALQEKELLLSEASRIAHIGAWSVDVTTDPPVSVWSEEVYHIHEVPLDYEIKSAMEFYHRDSEEIIREGLTETMQTGKPFSVEAKINTGTGKEKWIKIEGKAIRNNEGHITTVRGFLQDIDKTKRRELELEKVQQELRHQNVIFREAEEAAKIGSWEYDMERDEVFWSEEFRRIHEVDENYIPRSSTALDFVNPPFRLELQERYEKAVEDNEPFEMQLKITTAKDTQKWVLAKVMPVPEENKVRGVYLDITELKEKKLALRRYNRELEKQQRLLNQAERMAKLGYWEWHDDEEEMLWSEQLYEIYEVPEDFTPGRRDSINYFYSKKSKNRIQAAMNKAQKEGITFSLETRIKTYRNNRKWIRLQGSPLRNSSGSVNGTFGTVQDISNIKKKELELQKTSEIIAKQNNRLMDFTQIVSHNLRSHSSNIQTMLDLMEKNPGQQERDTFYKYIRETADSLDETLEHLHQVIKVQSDTKPKIETLSIEKTLHSVLNILEGEIQKTNARIQFQLKATECKCFKPYLESILLNLISNGIKYRHPERDPVLQVRTYSHKGTGKTTIEIEDNGQGFDMERHGQKLFGMYKTFHDHPNARGIGLFITKNHVEALGGHIEAESKEGEGSLFRVTF